MLSLVEEHEPTKGCGKVNGERYRATLLGFALVYAGARSWERGSRGVEPKSRPLPRNQSLERLHSR